jgi:exodeoxyribonuclease VII large subunit
MQKKTEILRVSEINRYVKNLITGDPRLQDIRVGGELSNFKHHRSGHMYFTLKDSQSSLRCVYFRGNNVRCLFQPADGMEVVISGNLSVYEPDGAYQLYVNEMEPAGVGSLYLAFEQLKEKLAAEGLFRPERKQELPFLPRKIGVVTSPTGAALQDMLTVFRKRFPALQIVVVESLVQGSGAAADLIRALDFLNTLPGIDLIILARGGGSLEDLWPFNEEQVARAIFRSRLPVMSAVGHETDFTIADFVADLRAPTPTAAAQYAVPDLQELINTIIQLRRRAAVALQGRIQREKQKLDQVTGERFYNIPVRRLSALRDNLLDLNTDLRKNAARLLQYKGMQLASKTDKLEGFSPFRVMSRGYSFCRNDQGEIVRSIKNIEVGSLLHLNFTDGLAKCRTEVIEEGNIFEGEGTDREAG